MLLKSVIPVLLDSISDVTLTSAATQALRDICQECAHDLDRESQIAIVNKCQVHYGLIGFIGLFSLPRFVLYCTVGNVCNTGNHVLLNIHESRADGESLYQYNMARALIFKTYL